jgi:hypothetical protein
MRIVLLLLAVAVLAAGCAGPQILYNPKTEKYERVEPYGLFNQASKKRDDVVYDISAGTVIVSIVFCETIVIPVLGVGNQLWEPVRFDTNR